MEKRCRHCWKKDICPLYEKEEVIVCLLFEDSSQKIETKD